MSDVTPEEQKAILKEALQEWLDAKYSEFGRWTMNGIMAAALSALVLFLVNHGAQIKDFIK